MQYDATHLLLCSKCVTSCCKLLSIPHHQSPFQHVASPTRADGKDEPRSSAVVLSRSTSQISLAVQANDEERPVAAFEITEHGSKLALTSQWLEHLQVWLCPLALLNNSMQNLQFNVAICPYLRAVLSWRTSVHTWRR